MSVHFLGIYVDFDNIWGGFLESFGFSTESSLSRGERLYLLDLSRNFIRACLNPYSELWNQFNEEGGVRPAFIKIFADFEALPFKEGVIDALQETGAIVHYPFVRRRGKHTKDASDRALILEVVADVFFKRSGLTGMILCTGDIDYFPLIRFLKEYKPDFSVYLWSFRNRANTFYKENAHLFEKIFYLDDFITGEVERLRPRETAPEEKLYEKFRDRVLRGLKNWFGKGKEYATKDLILKNWLPRWAELSILSYEDGLHFLKRMEEEGLIVSESREIEGKIRTCYRLIDFDS